MSLLNRPFSAFPRRIPLGTHRRISLGARPSPYPYLYLPLLRSCGNRPTTTSHSIRHFSQSSILCIRRTYFPNKRTDQDYKKNESAFTQAKRAINALPSNVILWTVLGLNGVVYLLWNVGIFKAKNEGDMSVLIGLQKNFTLSWDNWKDGRFWTLLTSCFSNQATTHILMNALTFYFMAPPVLQILGNVSFLTLYLGGGIASSMVTLFANEIVLHKRRVVHGASGAIFAVISFMACVAPTAKFLIFGIIPVPAWGCVAGLFSYDLFNAITERQTGVSEISHLAGMTAGLLYFVRLTGRFPRL
ncbi:hypothetical protein K439DRAFT_1625883 [Ramaria rubella]|nr:hypothetical protein K439DRAFT_1625883 [Ramaria rubella]